MTRFIAKEKSLLDTELSNVTINLTGTAKLCS